MVLQFFWFFTNSPKLSLAHKLPHLDSGFAIIQQDIELGALHFAMRFNKNMNVTLEYMTTAQQQQLLML